VREIRGSYDGFVVGCIPSYAGPGNFSGGCSPHWVNHVNLCLYCIVYLLCFVSTFVLFYCSMVLFF
jgi:hypothetical protein